MSVRLARMMDGKKYLAEVQCDGNVVRTWRWTADVSKAIQFDTQKGAEDSVRDAPFGGWAGGSFFTEQA